jgi:hypothetical protein
MTTTQNRRIKMKISGRFKVLSLSLFILFLAVGCVSRKVTILTKELAKQRINEPVLVFPPLTSKSNLSNVAEKLGRYYSLEVPKRVNGPVVYASNIDSLKDASDWHNLIKNGTVNTMEVAAMGKALNCSSVLTCRILEINQYPPFRIVLQLNWIDSDSGNIIGKLYQDIDLADSETKYRYKNYVGQGLAAEAYEQIFYSEDKYQTAYLMPQEFYRYAASYTCNVLFGDVKDFPWWWFWRSIG